MTDCPEQRCLLCPDEPVDRPDEPEVIPLPGALVMMLGALGMLWRIRNG